MKLLIHTLLLFTLLAPPAADDALQAGSTALENLRQGRLEDAQEGFLTAAAATARKLARECNTSPLRISAVELYMMSDTGEVRLTGTPALQYPAELLLRLRLSGLDREEKQGRFRHGLRHSVIIRTPDGQTLLDETPVDMVDDFHPYTTRLQVTDRIPLEADWPAGTLEISLSVDDLLCPDATAAHAETRLDILLQPRSPDRK